MKLFELCVSGIYRHGEKVKIGEEGKMCELTAFLNFEILHGLDRASVNLLERTIFRLDCPYFDSQRGKSRLHTLYVCTHERRRPFRAFFFWWIDRKGQGDEADIPAGGWKVRYVRICVHALY